MGQFGCGAGLCLRALALGGLLFAALAHAGASLRLFWDASPAPNVVGYNVYYGAASRRYTNVVRVGNVTEATLDDLPLAPALYFAVTATDANGLESGPSNELVWSPPMPQTNAALPAQPVFRVRGQGYISPDYSTRALTPGKVYTVTAIPLPGHVFAGWSGSFPSANPRLRFTMQPGLVLEANFILNPFAPLAGQYTGLFCETNGVRHDRAGCFTVSLTTRGTYSGRLQFAGARLAFSGSLQLNGETVQTLPRRAGPPLTLHLQFGANGDSDLLLGSVASGSEWSAALRGDRAVFDARTNSCPFAGQYTLAILGKETDRALPAGHGGGTVRVTPAGKLYFSGALADTARVSLSTSVAKSGRWPFYASLYGGGGSAFGWLDRENRANDDLHGAIAWTKPAGARFYPAGFADTFDALGSVFAAPATAADSVLPFANGQAAFDGPCLGAAFTNPFALGPKDQVLNLSSNRLALSFSRSSGAFAGWVTEPATGRSRALRGVVLQRAGVGLGFLECDGETARAVLSR
jgi:hypothetical protein